MRASMLCVWIYVVTAAGLLVEALVLASWFSVVCSSLMLLWGYVEHRQVLKARRVDV